MGVYTITSGATRPIIDQNGAAVPDTATASAAGSFVTFGSDGSGHLTITGDTPGAVDVTIDSVTHNVTVEPSPFDWSIG